MCRRGKQVASAAISNRDQEGILDGVLVGSQCDCEWQWRRFAVDEGLYCVERLGAVTVAESQGSRVQSILQAARTVLEAAGMCEVRLAGR
jgi:hypothetical protein